MSAEGEAVRIIREKLDRSDLVALAERQFGDMVKAVVDVNRGIIAIGGELHSDEEATLLNDGSRQHDLWGINLYPFESDDEWIEYDSMINVRPSQSNRSRGVEDATLRRRIRETVDSPGEVINASRQAGHGGLAAGRWGELTLAEQLAHVGSEVERAIRAHETGRQERHEHALTRALDLFDLTANDERWHGHRRREILRTREGFCELFFSDRTPPDHPDRLRRYFLQFAILARRTA